MSRRFGMTLRKKSGSLATTALLRPRRRAVPPKKDDLSVLTWKEQQMIEKAQLASLKTSNKNSSPTRPGTTSGDDEEEDEISRSFYVLSSDDSETSDESEDGQFESPATAGFTTSVPSRGQARLYSAVRNLRCRTVEVARNNMRHFSSNRSSRQSFGSVGSFSDLISPQPPAPSGGGFAARKSAYTGVIGDSDDDSDDDEESTSNRRFGFNDAQDDNGDADGPGVSSRKLPPVESMPTTEDFLSYLVLKGINCVPDELRYVGDLQWETVRVKRKNASSAQKRQAQDDSPESSAGPMASPTVVATPKQVWAKKAIARAKKSLLVNRDGKRLSSSSIKPLVKTKSESRNRVSAKLVVESLSFAPKSDGSRGRSKKGVAIGNGKAEGNGHRKKSTLAR